MKRLSFIIIVSISFLSLLSCNSENLGDNFALMMGDKEKDNSIVYCTAAGLGSCNAGTYVVPTYDLHMQDGKYAEYVKQAKSNDDWIIAKTYRIPLRIERYWIIDKRVKLNPNTCATVNCDSILQANVKGPFALEEFDQTKQALNIDMDF